MSKLTPRQEMFCLEYLKDLNGTQAAIRAGYKAKSAQQAAFRILSIPQVRARIATLMDERAQKVKADADFVLKRLIGIDSLDIADILDANGDVLPIAQWPKEWRTSVSAFEISATKQTKETSVLVKKVKTPDKLKNLELIGKHIGVSAFKDKPEFTTSDRRELVIHVTSPETGEQIKQLQENLQND